MMKMKIFEGGKYFFILFFEKFYFTLFFKRQICVKKRERYILKKIDFHQNQFDFDQIQVLLLFPFYLNYYFIKRLLRKCQNYFTMEISERKILFFTLFCTKISITWKKLSIWYKKFAFADTFVYIYDISNCYLFYSIFAYIR